MSYRQKVYRVKGITPPEGRERWSAMHARAALASHADSIESAVFHRDRNGHRLQFPSDIRFTGGKNGFGVTLIQDIDDDDEFSLVKALMHFAVEHGGLLDMNSQLCDIERCSQYVDYHCILVIGKNGKKIKAATYNGVDYPERFKSKKDFNMKIITDNDFRDEQIKWEITKGISRQFQRLHAAGHFQLQDAFFLGRVDNGVLNQRSAQLFMDSIELKSVEMLSPAKRFLPRFKVNFSMPLNLSGNWAAGKLNNKGYGLLIKTNAHKEQ